MRTSLSSLVVGLGAVLAASACHPEDRCGKDLIWTGGSCIECPEDSTWSDGTCICTQPAVPDGGEPHDYFRFDGRECVLISDADLPPMDASADNDAGETGGATCADYCGFNVACIGGNDLAPAVVPDVIAALHSDDAAACASACEGTLGNDGSADPAVACMAAGQAPSMCDSLSGIDGLTAALTVVGDCCGTRKDNPLCASICAALTANAVVGSMIDFCD